MYGFSLQVMALLIIGIGPGTRVESGPLFRPSCRQPNGPWRDLSFGSMSFSSRISSSIFKSHLDQSYSNRIHRTSLSSRPLKYDWTLWYETNAQFCVFQFLNVLFRISRDFKYSDVFFFQQISAAENVCLNTLNLGLVVFPSLSHLTLENIPQGLNWVLSSDLLLHKLFVLKPNKNFLISNPLAQRNFN